jgi:glutaminyl-peptide cyclotransferase
MSAQSKMMHAKACMLALVLLLPGIVCLGQSTSKPAPKSLPTSSPTSKATDFDAARAYEHVKRMVEIGPHPAGSEAIKKAQDYIIKELKSYGLKVSEDNFVATTPHGTVPMKNIAAELAGEKPGIILITGHYDTKLQEGFVGANDGGSSTAAVLEMARALAKTKPEYTLWFVLFDGEEAVVEWSAMNGMDNTYGSRHMVSKLKADGALNRVKAMILVDMIGDKNLNIKREGESTDWLVDLMWAAAHKMGYSANYLLEEQYISDDHLPFKEAGIPVIDFIDFSYGPDHSYWHTNQDTLDKISGESMKAVGDVIITTLPDLFKRLNNPPHKPAKPAAQ